MKNLFASIALALLTVFLVAGCGRDAGHAKGDLIKMNYQFTPDDFVRAARAGDEKALKLFLAAGIEVNAADRNGTTALIGAAENNALKIIRLLARRGVDYDKKDREGWTALMKAIYGNHLGAVQLLAEFTKEDLNRGLLLASLLGHTEVAQWLLTHGAEADAVSDDGLTPLAYARKNGNAALETLLLEAGAEPVAASAPDATPVLTPGPPATSSLVARELFLKNPKTTPDSPEEAWWKKYGLDLTQPDIFATDADEDGFSNAEEFLADSSPIDPSSRPPVASKLTFLSFHRESLPYRLEKVENRIATLRSSDGTRTPVKTGDTIGSWTVTNIRERPAYDKDGRPYTATDVAVRDDQGQTIRLVPGIGNVGSGSYVSVRLHSSEEIQRLHPGEEFTLPHDGNRRYVVLDLREDQVVLKEIASGATYTIGK